MLGVGCAALRAMRAKPLGNPTHIAAPIMQRQHDTYNTGMRPWKSLMKSEF